MKIFITILLLSLVMVAGCTPAPEPAMENPPEPQEPTIDEALGAYGQGEWITDYQEALRYAQELGRPILMNFTGSDWCSWCIKLRNEVFSRQEFTDYAKDNLVLLTIDFPRVNNQSQAERAQNNELQERLGITGYPTIVLVNSEGIEINRTGYRPGGASSYVDHLKQLLVPKAK